MPTPPTDLDLLRSIYRHLDRDALLEAHPGLEPDDLVAFFRRLSASVAPRPSPASAASALMPAPPGRAAHGMAESARAEPPRTHRAAQRAAPAEADRPPELSGRKRLILNTDGGSRGNPGPAGFGFVLTDESGRTVAEKGVYIGAATNNEAEYGGLLAGLEEAQARGATDLLIRSDSLLLVRQVQGAYKVKSRNLAPLVRRARELLAGFASWRAEHIPRELNSRADALANEAMDRRA